MILREGHPTLAIVCRPFDFATDKPLELADRMWLAMRRERGLGLAAPQIGEPVRAFILADPEGDRACFNPELIVGMEGQERALEGCLSYPGIFIYVRRWRAVRTRYQGADGQWKERTFTGMQARAFQHELDHLDGRTLPNMIPAQAWTNAKAAARLKAA